MALEDIQSFSIQPESKDGRIKFPNITILVEATRANNAISRRRELNHRISVWITLREVAPDSELSRVKLWRYAEAIERVLASDPTLGGKAVNSVVTSHEYPLNVEKEFVKKAVLIIKVLEWSSTGTY